MSPHTCPLCLKTSPDITQFIPNIGTTKHNGIGYYCAYRTFVRNIASLKKWLFHSEVHEGDNGGFASRFTVTWLAMAWQRVIVVRRNMSNDDLAPLDGLESTRTPFDIIRVHSDRRTENARMVAAGSVCPTAS